MPHQTPSDHEYGLPPELAAAPRRRHHLVLAATAVLVSGLLVLTGLAEEHGAPKAMGSDDSGAAYPRQHAPRPEYAAPDVPDAGTAMALLPAPAAPVPAPLVPAPRLPGRAPTAGTSEPAGSSDGPLDMVREMVGSSTSTATGPLDAVTATLAPVLDPPRSDTSMPTSDAPEVRALLGSGHQPDRRNPARSAGDLLTGPARSLLGARDRNRDSDRDRDLDRDLVATRRAHGAPSDLLDDALSGLG